MSSDRHPRTILRWLAKLGLATAATLLALLVVELVLRALERAPDVKAIQLGSENCVYKRSTNPILGFELKANYRNETPDFIQSYARTNSHGQRDKERTIEKPDGVLRVLLLGDSVVEGYGLDEHETISRQLEGLYPDSATEVLNFGVSAYCTRAEVELLEVKGLQFDPDVVVLVFVENDFDNFNREAFPLGGTIERPAAVEALFLRSHLFRLTCVQLNLFHFGAETDPVRWNKQAIGDNNVVEGLQRFRELTDRHGFRPLIAIWPKFFDDRIEDNPFIPGRSDELVIERLAATHGIPSVRLSQFFKRHWAVSTGNVNPRLRYTSGDGLHPSNDGCRVAAEALKQFLADLSAGRLPGGTDASDSPSADAAAVEVARSLGKSEPTYARVYNRMGTELLKAGKLTEAVQQFNRALEEDPNYAGAHYNLGITYERLGRAEAVTHYERAVQLEPEYPHAHFNLARALLKKGRVTEAITELQRTIQIDPNHVGALRMLGAELGKRKRLAEARSYLERAVRIAPDHSEAHNNLGAVYVFQGQLQKAVAQFQEALRADPDNAKARENLRKTQSMIPR